ncbi:hypothetical protein P4B35_12850, partial [Pontiellaceae bacterium B12227]|nr:hypothetical protein [Pontiellaceae bacterium B12227]
KPAPRLQPTPPVEPVPEVKKPEPVVAVVKPKPAPSLQPTPPVEPIPEVKKPEPVVAVVKPEPIPEVVKNDDHLESLLASIDKVEEQPDVPVKDPDPMKEDKNLIALMATSDQGATSPESEPVEKDDHLESLLASIDKVDEKSSKPVSDPESMKENNMNALLAAADKAEGSSGAATVEPEVKAESEMSILLASLGSHGSESPDPVQEAAPEQDDLAAYVQQLTENAISEPETEVADVQAITPAASFEGDEPIRYVTSSKSANILVELLTKDQPKTSASLGSFLDGLVEDINDKH